MDDPATAQNSLGAIAPGHTGLIYDALELVQDDAEQYNVNAFTAQIQPTIFYRETKAGMVEVVDVFISGIQISWQRLCRTSGRRTFLQQAILDDQRIRRGAARV